MTTLKIHITNSYRGFLIQKILFKKGAKWGGDEPYKKRYLVNRDLFVSKDKLLFTLNRGEVPTFQTTMMFFPSTQDLEFELFVKDKIIALLKEGRPIGAIQEYRKHYRKHSLRICKEKVEEIKCQLQLI